MGRNRVLLAAIVVFVVMAAALSQACGGVEESTDSGGGWTTFATLDSSAPADTYGNIQSAPFEASGKTRFVLDMPGAESTDGLAATVVPADKANDPTYMNGESIVMNATFNTDEVNLPAGSYVLQVLMPGLQKWTVAIQSKD